MREALLLWIIGLSALREAQSLISSAVGRSGPACVSPQLSCRLPRPQLLIEQHQKGPSSSLGEEAGEDIGGGGPREGLVAASALASSAIIAEAVQLGGTAVLFYLAQQWTGASSPVEAVSLLVTYLQDMGGAGYAVFAGLMIFLQVVPVAAAFVLTLSAGALFGAVKGTALVLSCSTFSASISFLLSKSYGRGIVLKAVEQSPQYRAIDRAFANAGFATALTLITLLRLSPILPFSWANYVFGLSGVPWAPFSLGTFLGCFPAVTAYVSAGQLGAEIIVNGAESNSVLLGGGIAATLAAITIAGRVASQALRDMDLDLESIE